MKDGRYAVLDLGTNTFNLLISEIKLGKARILVHERTPVKIGAGGIQNKIIVEEACLRAENAIVDYLEIIKKHKTPIKNVTAIATSAFRNAKNGEQLAQRIFEKTQIKVHIIQGDKEAELIYYGVKAAMKIGQEPVLLMDIGGGSVEFIICNDDEIFWKKSFEIGAQRLFDVYHTTDPIQQSAIEELNYYLDKSLVELKTAVSVYHPKILVGSSGTFDTLCEIFIEEHNIKHDLYDGTEYDLPIHYFGEIFYRLIVKNVTQRRDIKGMSPMRVDMVVVATCLIDYVLRNYLIQRLRVSFYSLKEGVMYLMAHDEHIF